MVRFMMTYIVHMPELIRNAHIDDMRKTAGNGGAGFDIKIKSSPKRRLHPKKLEHSRSGVRDVGERVPRICEILKENKD